MLIILDDVHFPQCASILAGSKVAHYSATNDVSLYYHLADLSILYSRCKNFGMVFAEAMVARNPVIGRDCGGASKIIDDESIGRVLPMKQNNSIELVDAFTDLTTAPDWKF